jgi:hypothetical protein
MNILNIFRCKVKVNVVYSDLSFIKKNITLSKIPDINQKIYFDEEKIYIVIDVIHYYNNGVQVIWLIVKNFNEQTPPEILTDK